MEKEYLDRAGVVELTTDIKNNITTHKTFPTTWTTNLTMSDLFTDIENDTDAKVGMTYLGEVTCSDLPFSGNAEIVVNIMTGTGTNKILFTTLTSSNVAPYYWQYTYGNGHNSGWQTFLSADNIPTADGTYVYKCVVSSGTPTFQWVLE